MISYERFVVSKAAPFYHLSTSEFHLTHACLGLATEYLEYSLADDEANVKEELGDIAWYMMLAAHALSLQTRTFRTKLGLVHKNLEPRFAQTLEEFISTAKKHCIYRVPRPLELREKYEALWLQYILLVTPHGYTVEEITEANRAKLERRYATSFTPQESEDRRDKAE